MAKISPSIIGTTFATILATIYVSLFQQGLHLWTPVIHFVILACPVVVLVVHSIAAYFEEAHGEGNRSWQMTGHPDYFLRVFVQLFLGLSLAAITEDFRIYIALFMCFVFLTSFWSVLSSRKVSDLNWYDTLNFAACVGYAFAAMRLYQLAQAFERTYLVFSSDSDSFRVHVESARGEMMDYVAGVSLAIGMIVVVNVLALKADILGSDSRQAAASNA